MQASSGFWAAGNGPKITQSQMDQFVGAHERFLRSEPRARRAVMRFSHAPGLDFTDRTLVESDFTGANLKGALFLRANLERAAFYCADLRGSDLREANFFRADLRGASLRQSNLAGARLDDCDMREAVLVRAEQEGSYQASAAQGRAGPVTVAVDFTNCSMKRVRLCKAKLKGANFTGAMLHGADLKGAHLDRARFDGAVLTGVDLSQVRLDPDALARCVLDPTAEILQRCAELRERLATAHRWVVTNGGEGAPAMLDGEDLRPLGKVFEGAILTALSAKNVRAIGVSFRGAQLQGARFDGADLREADFTGADLRGASLRGANLWHARFKDADMRPLAMANGVHSVDVADSLGAHDRFADSLQA